MSAQATSHAESVTSAGREANGRFARGNPGGCGNPFARQVAALRAALIEVVTPQDMKEIAYILLLNAKGGDLASIKLLFQYVIGKPQPAVDPDTLDREEIKAFHQDTLHADQLETLRTGVPASAILPYQRIHVEAQEKQLGEAFLDQLQQWEQEHVEETPAASPMKAARSSEKETVTIAAKPAPRTRPVVSEAPSANGFDGDATEPAPSPNGQHRSATEMLFRWLRGQTSTTHVDSEP